MAMKKMITKVLSCLVVCMFLMSAMSISIGAMDSNNATGNASNYSNGAIMPFLTDNTKMCKNLSFDNMISENDNNKISERLVKVTGESESDIWFEGTVIEPDNGLIDGCFDCKVEIDRIITDPGNIDVKEGDEVLIEKFIFCDPGGTVDEWYVEVDDSVEVYGKISKGDFSCPGHSDSSFFVDLCGSDSYYFEKIGHSSEVKFQGEVVDLAHPISFPTLPIVKISKIIEDPTNGLEKGEEVFVCTLYDGEAQVDSVGIGDKVEVYGEYTSYDDIGIIEHKQILVTDSDHYLKKLEKEKPDLIIQDISWSPSNPKEGDIITFTIKVKNQGEGDAGECEAWSSIVVGSDVSICDFTFTVPSLTAGEEFTYTNSCKATKCGEFYVAATVDFWDAVEESNDNNYIEKPISISCIEKPDLVIQKISWSPSNPKRGDTVTINVKTKNKGSGNAGGFYVCYYVDGSYYDRDYASSLSTGLTTTTSFTWTADCGSHSIKAVADYYDDIGESNEDNNEKSITIEVGEEPKDIKFIGTFTGQNWPMGFGAYYFKVDKVLEGSIPVGDDIRVMVYTSAYPDPLNNYDRLKKGDKAEVYAEFEEELGKRYDSWVDREVWAADITGDEKYYVKKVEGKRAFDPTVDGYRQNNFEITLRAGGLTFSAGLLLLNEMPLVFHYNILKVPYFAWATFTLLKGSCAGISATSALYYIDPSEKPALLRNTDVYAFPLSATVLEEIAYYQAAQLLFNVLPCYASEMDEKREFEQIKADIDKNGVALIALGKKKLIWTFWDHMVVGYEYGTLEDESFGAVRIYDPNFPGNQKYSIGFEFDNNRIRYLDYEYAAAADIDVIASESTLRKNIDAYKIRSSGIENLNMLIFQCPVNIKITDEHGRIISDDGTNEIPDADVLITKEIKIFYLPADLRYSVDIDAYDTGTFNFTRVSPIGNDISITKFENISVTSSTKASVEIEPGVTDYTMSIDYNGDGVTDEEKSPDVSETVEVTTPTTIVFEDDFGELNFNNWIPLGTPSPRVLASVEGRTGVFDNNGDANCNSGVVSKDNFSFPNGFTMESDMYLNVTNVGGCWNSAVIGLTRQNKPTGVGVCPSEDYPMGVIFGTEYDGDACWATPPEKRRRAYFIIGLYTEEGTWESVSWLNADDYTDAWHNFKIAVGSDRIVKFYVDNELIYTSEKRINETVLQEKKILLGIRSSGSAGKSYHDFIKVNITTPSIANIIYVPDDYPTIQQAVNAANSGDTINVRDGTYTENVNVTKSLTIKSTSGNPEDTIILPVIPGNAVFNVIMDHVDISGFTVKGANVGIRIDHAHYCTISENICENNTFSIFLKSSSNNSLNNNIAPNNDLGICLYSSSKNTLTNNNVSNCTFGISLARSSDNTLTNNNALNNWFGIYVVSSSSNNKIFLNNFINNSYNVLSNESTNICNSTSKITYKYNGETYENFMGNYWSAYAGSDINMDGIGDTAYNINSDKDNHPLMQPWENYFGVSQPNLKITITSDKEDYSPGDTVNITTRFEIIHATPEEPVIITNPISTTFTMAGKLIFEYLSPYSECYTFTGDGGSKLIRKHTIPEDAPEGYYDVTVSFSGGKYVKTTENLFYVTL